MRPAQLRIDQTNTSITAVEFWNDIIVTGEGSILSALKVQTKKTLFREDVLYGSRIHGIRFKRETVPFSPDHSTCCLAVYGGKSFSVLHVDFGTKKILKSSLSQVEDWIWDLKWEQHSEQLILALGHNCLMLWDVLNRTACQKLTCQEQCILYSCCLVGNTWPEIGLLVGTVFKEIVIWTASDRTETADAVPVTHRLKGHSGVIFCICVDVELSLICSTSDDRTARLWKFSLSSNNQTISDIQFWKDGTFSLMHILAGHESRVWRAAILSKTIITVGEDSKLCFWAHTGSLIRSQKCPGTGLWCISVSKDQNLVVTGGKDGSLTVHAVKSDLEWSEIDLPLVYNANDFPRTLSVWSCHQGTNILVTTDSGFLLSYSLYQSKWTKLYQNSKLKGYSVLAVNSEGEDDIAIGSLSGSLYWLSRDSSDNQDAAFLTSEHQVYSNKIHSLAWLRYETGLYLLTCDHEGNMVLYLSSKEKRAMDLKRNSCFLLPPCKQRWVAAACLYSMFCVIGDRMGSVHVYRLKTSSTNPMQTFKNVHGQDCVACIQKDNIHLYTAGKDGQICVYNQSNFNLCLLHKIKTTKYMDWIGKLIFAEIDLLITGFKSTKFVVWSQESQQSLTEVECGGGHRSWDVALTSALCGEGLNLILACTRKKKIQFWCSQNFENLMSSVLRKGFHGDKIWCVTKIFSKGTSEYYATGGEDNLIVLSKMTTSGTAHKQQLQPVQHLTGHVSSVRALAVHSLTTGCTEECILASAGGKAQLLLWKIVLSKDILSPALLCQHFLWSLDVPPRQLKRELPDFSLPLTRYMDVALVSSATGVGLDVVLACSDACIRVFTCSLDPLNLFLKCCVEVGKWCYLKLLPLPHLLDDYYMFLTGSTCGTLRLWSYGEVSQPTVLDNLAAHTAGINCIHYHSAEDSSLIVGSGGDDNCLTLSLLNVPACKLQILTKIDSAHSSQITGIHIFGSPNLYIVTAGIDQRVTVWCYTPQSKQVEYECSMCTSVTDPAALLVSSNRSSAHEYILWLVGGGIQTLHLLMKS